MTTDVDRVSEFAWHIFTFVGSWYSPLRLTSIINFNAGRSHRDRHRDTLFVWFTWYEDRIVVLSKILNVYFFRCLFLHRSRRNMPNCSLEPLCWKSGHWCVTFMYVPEVWYLALYLYSCSRKSDEGSWWTSLTHEWSALVFDLIEWWMNCYLVSDLTWNPYAQSMSNAHSFLNTLS